MSHTPRSFNPADRTYEISEECMRAFRQLTPEQRLHWAEQIAGFLRLARLSRETTGLSGKIAGSNEDIPLNETYLTGYEVEQYKT